MDRIVVDWMEGDYECSYGVVACIEYSSIEAFYCELEEAVQKYIGAYTTFRQELEKWNEEIKPLRNSFHYIPPRKIKEKVEAETKLSECQERQPRAPERNFALAGRTWDLHKFIQIEGKGHTFYADMPNIRKLDEWFKEQMEENQLEALCGK